MKKQRQQLNRYICRHLHPSGEQGVFEEENFCFAAKREEERADRMGGQFSVVVFELFNDCKGDENKTIVEVIAKKIRITDSVGWVNKLLLGVLLPDTSRQGAQAFESIIARELAKTGLTINTCIHTYPPPFEKSPNQRTVDSTEQDRFFNELTVVPPPHWRRFAESFFSATALLLLSPLMLLIAGAIKLSSHGPVLFVQTRIGQKGIPFLCYKFRTMHLNTPTEVHENYFAHLMETDIPMQKMDKQGDPRIFPVGRLLRASSLDELPQLINILKGEMSLIGPRPSTPWEYNQYLPWQRHRVDTLPGLTGLWQVSGKNHLSFTEMMRLDNYYVLHQSVWMDFIITLKTLPVMIRQYMEDRRANKSFCKNQLAEKQDLLSDRTVHKRNLLTLFFLFAIILAAQPLCAAQVVFCQTKTGSKEVENRLKLAARFYGIDIRNVSSLSAGDNPEPLVIDASCLQDLDPADIPPNTPAVLIAGVSTQNSSEILNRWTGTEVQPEWVFQNNDPKNFVEVCTSHRNITMELTGQKLPAKIASGYQLRAPKESALIVYPNERALFTLHQTAEHPVYLLAEYHIPRPVDETAWLRNRSFFAELAPYLLFIKQTLGEHAWHSNGDYANLTIDDPWLIDNYGPLNFADLLKEMEQADFHTSIAFIPWNYNRNFSPEVLDLFRTRTDRYSLCIHGNNHDHREFYRYKDIPGAPWPARPLTAHEANIQQGVARMEHFRLTTDVAYDHVMVFPHGIAPAPTLALLSKYNFLATSNIGNIPLDSPPPEDPVFWLRRSTDRFGDLPALNRTHTHRRTETDIAIDLYLDNPVLFVEHVRFFASGLSAFNRTSEQVNRIQPETRWASLGTIAQHLYLMQKKEDGIYAVRAFSPEIILHNPEKKSRVYRIRKRITENTTLKAVLADEKPIGYTREDGWVQLELRLPPESSRAVKMVHCNDFDSAEIPLSANNLKINALRVLSDVRDRHLSAGFSGDLIDQLYYDTNFYQLGLKGLGLAALAVLLTPSILTLSIHRHKNRKNNE